MRTKSQIHCLTGHTNTVSSIQAQGVDPQVLSGATRTEEGVSAAFLSLAADAFPPPTGTKAPTTQRCGCGTSRLAAPWPRSQTTKKACALSPCTPKSKTGWRDCRPAGTLLVPPLSACLRQLHSPLSPSSTCATHPITPTPSRFTFASASPDNIKQWYLPQGKFIQNLSGHNAIINSMAVSPDGILVSGADNGTLKFWDYKTGHCFQRKETTPQPGASRWSTRVVHCPPPLLRQSGLTPHVSNALVPRRQAPSTLRPAFSA